LGRADVDLGVGDDDPSVMTVSRLNRLVSDLRGTAVIEFGILAPVLFAMLLGGVEFGRMFYVRQGLEGATEAAARYYMLNPGYTQSQVTTYLRSQMFGGMGSGITVGYADTTSCNSNTNATCTMITTTYSFTFVAAYLGLGTRTMTAKAQAVRQTSG
jgi:Flp pilus assembly protein TadG